jgi:hypothetical protein
VPDFLIGIDPRSVQEIRIRLEDIARNSANKPAGAELLEEVDLSGYRGLGGVACILTSVTEIDDEKGPVD